MIEAYAEKASRLANARVEKVQSIMWCRSCQQDVPAKADASQQRMCCGRCGEPFSPLVACGTETVEAELIDTAERHGDDDLDELRLIDPRFALPLDLEKFEQQLRDAEWTLQRVFPYSDATEAGEIPQVELSASSLFEAQYSRRALPAVQTVAKETGGKNPAGWGVLVLGVATFVCGAVLLGWSYMAERPELWSLGVPITLAGQAGLLLGLVMLLERLSHENRSTADHIQQLDERMHDIRSGSNLSWPGQPTGQAFYNHLAEGAKPEMLLNDLQRQLELLAIRLADRSDGEPRG